MGKLYRQESISEHDLVNQFDLAEVALDHGADGGANDVPSRSRRQTSRWRRARASAA